MKSIHGKETVLKEVPGILTDESKFTLGVPEAVYYPETVDDLSAVMTRIRRSGKSVVGIGGQTGVVGGAVPGDGSVAVHFQAMNRIVRVELSSQGLPILYCQPGCSLHAIAEFLDNPAAHPDRIPGAAHLHNQRWCYIPDPTEMSATVAGTVATNASGSRSFKFGPTRHHVEKMTVILANGETASIERGKERFRDNACTFTTEQGTAFTIPAMGYESPMVKNTCGYYSRPDMDLIDLFIGSEGTLALFAEIGILLVPEPAFVSGLTFFPGALNAFAAAALLRAHKQIASLEYFDKTALTLLVHGRDMLPFSLPCFPHPAGAALYWEYMDTEDASFDNALDSLETLFNECGSSFEDTWSGTSRKEQEHLKLFRHAVPELVNTSISRYKREHAAIRKVSTDAAIPMAFFNDHFFHCVSLMQASNLEHVVFGHLGDCHIHFNMIPHTGRELEEALELYESIVERVIADKGAIAAEHGIGKIKKKYLQKMYPETVLAEMKRTKSILDPYAVLNPHTIFE